MVGGKYTPYRAFGEQVTDRILKEWGRRRRLSTRDLPIGGGKGFPLDEADRRAWLDRLRQQTGLAAERIDALVLRYGTRAEEVAALCAAGPDAPLAHHAGYTRREIAFLIERERVCHVEDIVLRRTSIAFLGEVTAGLLEELAAMLGEHLGWSEATRRDELARTRDLLRERHRIDAG
jgi:glycerol-3-phosphate dehydrogenase